MADKRSSRSSDARPKEAAPLVLGYIRSRADAWLADDLRRTRAGLARLSGLTAEQVHDLLNGSRTPTQRSLRAVARALGISFDDLDQSAKLWAERASHPTPPAASNPGDRYPNRARAIAAAAMVDHDPRDIETVRAVVLPPGVTDPAALVWLRWIDKAREERDSGKSR